MTLSGKASVLLAMVMFCTHALSAEQKKFIPWSPLNEAEVASRKEKLKRGTGIPAADLDRMLRDVDRNHTYREADIVAAFPELRGTTKLSECSNNIMGGATELVFIAKQGEHDLTLKKTRCARAKNGVECEAVTSEQRYFLENPEKHFALENLTFEEARSILDAVRTDGVSGLPDWINPSLQDIRQITALPDDSFRMIYGDFLCAGCAARFEMRLESKEGQSRWVMVGKPDGGCF